MAAEQEKSVVSFGFSKKPESKGLKLVDGTCSHKNKDQLGFATAFETEEVNSSDKEEILLYSRKQKEEKKEIVIPLIKTNNWKTQVLSKASGDVPEKASQLDSLAVQEIITDAAKQNEDWDAIGKTDSNIQIPLLMQNKIPDGYETDDKLDVSLRPDEPEEADYDEIPIDAYGLAMLKGMGWKPGQGIGKNNKSIVPVEAVLRPKGMGLGADRKQAQNLNDSKKGGNSKKSDDDGELTLKKGSCCLVEHGPHKDLYGKVEGLDEDNARLMVKLTVSGKSVNVSQYNIKLVTNKEYAKYSKYINKGAADRYKNKDRKEKETENEGERSHRPVEDRLSDHGSELRDREKDRRKDKYREESSEKSRKRKYDERSDKSYNLSHSTSNGSSQSSKSRLWVRPKIRVRIIDKNYKKGKHYNAKVVVVDVFDKDHCVCETEEGRVLEDISQDMLETVVPKSESAYVAIVAGKYRGQVAHVLKRDKSKCEALLQLLSDRDNVIKVDYDSICEYVGDVNEEFDF